MYAELHCLSNFSFLRGASHPEELIDRARDLGYAAIAITDECSVTGLVRAHIAAKSHNTKLIIGSEFTLECGVKIVALAQNRKGYGCLSRLITRGRRSAEKGTYSLTRADVETYLDQCVILWVPSAKSNIDEGRWLANRFPGNVWIAVELLRDGAERERLVTLTQVSKETGLPLVASGDVHMHVRERRALQDVVTAIRLNVPVDQAGWHLFPNGERHLREPARLARLYPSELLAETLVIAERCKFSLDELRYEYPRELVPEGETATTYLRKLTEEGVKQRWPDGEPENVRKQIEHELALITDLHYGHTSRRRIE